MTKLLYLEDFNVESCDATIVSVNESEDGRIDLVLDQTCFYPRGGGQDWDFGEIKSESAAFTVEEVRLDENGDVHHIGNYSSGQLTNDDTVSCKVDGERRNINTRLHSGGHMIDMAIDRLSLDWVATKGQHYPHWSAVDYVGTWEPENAEGVKDAIESKINELIRVGTDNRVKFMPAEEMHTVCRHVPENIPTNKPARAVIYGDNFGIPCGGTHVKNLKEIGVVRVSKVKEKKGIIRVSYSVEGIN